MSSVSSAAGNSGPWVIHFLKSSVGAKIIMAISGLMMFGFLIGHIAGNLQIFIGQDAINGYAHFLKSNPEIVWPARIGLLGAVLVHIWSGLRLAALNKAARPAGYKRKTSQRSTVFSRTMTWSGLVVLAFIAYHLAHFTFGVTNPAHYHLTDELGRHDVYSMFVLGFQQPVISGFYILAMVLLGFHLAHGTKSMFQSLGLNHPKYDMLFQVAVPGLALLVVVGNIIMPLAVLGGFLSLPEGVEVAQMTGVK
ncbi:MAG: succinate dehydrogenase cytochrome b subunit [Myxococcota bacterium]